MSPSPKPTLAAVNAGDDGAFVAVLGHLFEHSPWVAAETFPRRPFSSLEDLLGALCATMRGAPKQKQLALVRAHPDLAGRLAKAGGLTASSAGEQASAGLDRLSAAESAEIQELNTAYLRRFGFPFVICARLNDKGTILKAMRARLGNGEDAELSTALDEIAKIAGLRLSDAVANDS